MKLKCLESKIYARRVSEAKHSTCVLTLDLYIYPKTLYLISGGTISGVNISGVTISGEPYLVIPYF